MSDIVDRLRSKPLSSFYMVDMHEAADEITRLRDELITRQGECADADQQLAQKDIEIKRLRDEVEKYNELIMAVEKKWPNETRHETALRYIVERENQSSGTAKEAK